MTDIARETSFRIGLDPVERLVLMENHDQALYTWREAGAKQRILVHIDAHHDMWWVKDKALVTIANFISPALREDLVREVFWVVPDASFDTPRDRGHILKHLKKIGKQYSRCATGGATGVPPVTRHGRDAHGTREHGQDPDGSGQVPHGTRGHGQDPDRSGQVPHGTSGQVAGATGGATGVPPVTRHGQDPDGSGQVPHGTTGSATGVPPVTGHGQDPDGSGQVAHVTFSGHGQDPDGSRQVPHGTSGQVAGATGGATGVPPVTGHGQDPDGSGQVPHVTSSGHGQDPEGSGQVAHGTSGQVPHGTSSGQVAGATGGATGVPPVHGHGQDPDGSGQVARGTMNATSEITLTVLGKTLHVCQLASLPRFDEPVLLDIDVDYLLIRRVTYGQTDEHGPLPWLWPEELLTHLAEREVRSDLATVVYSVEGGYTPLKWKYLGDELALRLKQPVGADPQIEGYRLMCEAAEAAVRGEQAAAEAKFQQAAGLLPASAAPHYHLAHLLLKSGRGEEARGIYRQALEADPSYRTAFCSAGLNHLWNQRLRAAEQEFQITLELDPDDATAHYGLADVAARRKRWAEAEALLRKSLAVNENLVDSHRLLGKILAKQGRRDEAIAAYERSLKLALTGHKPLAAPLLTATGEQRLLDPFISQTQERLGHLYAKQGKISEAVNSLRMSTGGGYDRLGLRARLAGLYLRQSRWKLALVETWHAVKMVPLEIKWACQRNYRRVKRFLSRGWAG